MWGENPIRAIKNGQSRYIGNTVHKTQNEGKQENKKKYTENFNDKQHDSTIQNRGEQR